MNLSRFFETSRNIVPSGRQTLIVLGLVLSCAVANPSELKFDETMFPSFKSDGVKAFVVQANWVEEIGGDKKDSLGEGVDSRSQERLIPMRLFGTVGIDVKSLKLHFSVDTGTTVALGERGGAEEKLPQESSDSKANDNSHDGDKTANLLHKENDSFQSWWYEGFLQVQEQKDDRPAVVYLRSSADNYKTVTKLYLGECWLAAGGPNVSVQLSVGGDARVAAVSCWQDKVSGFAVVTMAAQTSTDEKIEANVDSVAKNQEQISGSAGLPPSPSNETSKMAPALATCFGEELADLFSSKGKKSRPVCVYSWAAGRRSIKEWAGEGADNKPIDLAQVWAGLFDGSKYGYLLPGIHGVIWWHGEWEAERFLPKQTGTSTTTPDKSPTPAPSDSSYNLGLDRFATTYSEEGRELRRNVTRRLTYLKQGGDEEDDKIAARIIWVVLQSPGAGRRSEFFDVLYPRGTTESIWAELRAAQFTTVDSLRALSKAARPVDLLVPLETGRPGWIWGVPETLTDSLALFRSAGRRIATEVYRALSVSVGSNGTVQEFPDGWPIWVKHGNSAADPDILRLSGVTTINDKELVPPSSGVRTPVFETQSESSGPWAILKTAPTATPSGLEWSLPPGTIAVRYGWNDANAGLHTVQLKPDDTSVPLPLFKLNRESK